jgi:iron complex outermembrane receptor protein
MGEDAVTIDLGVEIKGQRVSEKQKAAPLTIESLDAIAIKQTASTDFYNGLGSLKGVDLTTASLGFTVINTRGFQQHKSGEIFTDHRRRRQPISRT